MPTTPTSPLGRLGVVRTQLQDCSTAEPMHCLELGDALLCALAIASMAKLSLGAGPPTRLGCAYDPLARGRVNVDLLRDVPARFLPAADRLEFAVDVTT